MHSSNFSLYCPKNKQCFKQVELSALNTQGTGLSDINQVPILSGSST